MSDVLELQDHNQIALANAGGQGQSATSWSISAKRGVAKGISAQVSGAGATAKLHGKMTFSAYSLDKSTTFQQMKKSYNIGGGVSGFWGWLGIGANASTHKSEISQAFHEAINSDQINGYTDFDLEATGQIPNFQVTASAYMMLLQVKDDQGNTYSMASASDPAADTGAQDQNGDALPSSNNNSTINI